MSLKFRPKILKVEATEDSAIPSVEEAVFVPEASAPVQLKYKALRLKRLIKANGQIKLPAADGFFYPETEEERNLLEYYARQVIAYVERT